MTTNTAKSKGYTLVEVLIAAAILLLVIAAAASLSSGLTTQELLAQRTAMALNEQEQAARLWQLGVSASAITNTLLPPNGWLLGISLSEFTNSPLPPNPSIQSMTFTESDVIFTNLGTMRRAELKMVMIMAMKSEDAEGNITIYTVPRTNALILLRP